MHDLLQELIAFGKELLHLKAIGAD